MAQLIWVEIPVYWHVIRVQVCGALSPDYIHGNGLKPQSNPLNYHSRSPPLLTAYVGKSVYSILNYMLDLDNAAPRSIQVRKLVLAGMETKSKSNLAIALRICDVSAWCSLQQKEKTNHKNSRLDCQFDFPLPLR